MSTTSSIAQDAHYWTEQYGNRSTLMSGSVVGSVTDLGAMYYNPARLALQDDSTFLISAKAYQMSILGLKEPMNNKAWEVQHLDLHLH